MKISLTQISISDRVNAAQIHPGNTDTSQIPGEIDPKPGDSTTAPIDTSQMNKAGGDIQAQTQQANRATSDSARKGQSREATSIQYPGQNVNPEDQAPTASLPEDVANTPQPASKGFRESLIDQQVANGMQERTGGDRTAPDRDYGRDNGDPNEYVKPQPNSQPIRRDKIDTYDSSRNRVPEPKQFPITSWENTNNLEPYKAPQNQVPVFKSKDPSLPKMNFSTPRINTPRFK
jgi:hypothetical protein